MKQQIRPGLERAHRRLARAVPGDDRAHLQRVGHDQAF